MTPRTEKVRLAVDLILRSYNESTSNDEREQIAKEIGRLDHGGARAALADMADRAWETG